MDFSGSEIKADITSAFKIKDKVASIGEDTNIFIEIKNVDESFLAAAIKDGSQATIILKGIKENFTNERKKMSTDSSTLAHTVAPQACNNTNINDVSDLSTGRVQTRS